MIKRETLKQAIDAIAGRDPEIGYALDEMLAVGKIDIPAPGQDPMLGDDFYFLFDGYKARVSRFLYINKGNIPIEERLLVKYGELRKKLELQESGESVDTPDAVGMIRRAGLGFMVRHEITYALVRIREQLKRMGSTLDQASESAEGGDTLESIHSISDPVERNRRLIFFLEALKTGTEEPSPRADPPADGILYRGFLKGGIAAAFVRFPYTLNALLQVADINIEFFHVRFFLNRLIQNQWQHLYACLAKDNIVGLLYLTLKGQMFHRNLEIKFIAAARSAPTGNRLRAEPPLRGVGTFLVAGAWLQWKAQMAAARELLLDSEIGARRFYDSLGFVSRGLSEYVLGKPRAFLLKAIVDLANSSPHTASRVQGEIGNILQKQLKSLRRRTRSEKDLSERQALLAAAEEFLKVRGGTESGETLLRLLHKYRKKIPEAAELFRLVAPNQSEIKGDRTDHAAGTHY